MISTFLFSLKRFFLTLISWNVAFRIVGNIIFWEGKIKYRNLCPWGWKWRKWPLARLCVSGRRWCNPPVGRNKPCPAAMENLCDLPPDIFAIILEPRYSHRYSEDNTWERERERERERESGRTTSYYIYVRVYYICIMYSFSWKYYFYECIMCVWNFTGTTLRYNYHSCKDFVNQFENKVKVKVELSQVFHS